MVVIPTEKRFDWKHAPLVLIAIVILNIAICVFYQSQDGNKFEQAISTHQETDLLATEWPVYQRYLSGR